mgnify:FL=1
MDSYTDVSTQCCGRGRMSCGTSFGNGCGSYTSPDYPDMNAFPWDSWGSNPALSYPTPAAPVTQPANMSCPSTEGGGTAVSGGHGLCTVAAVADHLCP